MLTTDRHKSPRTTIALKQGTKTRLDRDRAPGQCYDGFLSQLVDLWEHSDLKTRPGPAGGKPAGVG